MGKFLRKNAFWIIQILSWGSLALVTRVSGSGHGHSLTTKLFVASVFFCGLVATSIHRWFLRRFVKKGKFTLKKIATTLGLIFFTSLLFLVLSGVLGAIEGYLTAGIDLQNYDVSDKIPKLLEVLLVGTLSSIFLISVWTVLYFGIKSLISHNDARIQRLQLRDQVKRAQLNTLKGHINPNFMVYVLQKIKKLMLTDIPKSRQMLTELSELLRYSLTKNSTDVVSLEEEIEMAEKYMVLDHIDSSNTHSIKAETELKIEKIKIPPMLLLNFVELSTMSLVRNQTSNKNNQLNIGSNSNAINFKLISYEAVPNTGDYKILQKIIEQRLRLLYGDKGLLKIDRNSEETIFQLFFPVNIQDEIMSES